jgi:hypothetical protein
MKHQKHRIPGNEMNANQDSSTQWLLAFQTALIQSMHQARDPSHRANTDEGLQRGVSRHGIESWQHQARDFSKYEWDPVLSVSQHVGLCSLHGRLGPSSGPKVVQHGYPVRM